MSRLPLIGWILALNPSALRAATPQPELFGISRYLDTLLALLLVLALIWGLSWLIRRLNPALLGGGSGLKPVAALSLGSKERVVVIQCGSQQLLLSVTPGQVRCLHVLPEPLPELPVAAASFAQVLARLKGTSG